MTSTVCPTGQSEIIPVSVPISVEENVLKHAIPVIAEEDVLKHAVPVIADEFYFVRLNLPPNRGDIKDAVFFSTDSDLVYESFFDDFGPLNIAKVYRYCELMQKKLNGRQGRKVVHYSSFKDDRKFLNAAWLVGAFSVLKLNKSPEDVLPLLKKAAQRSLIGFRDASYGPSTYSLNLEDCLIGLHLAVQNHFFDYAAFDLTEYEHFERVENGDFNWITPKLLAFCGPHKASRKEGYPLFEPEDYFPYFKKHNISTIVRLNSPQYLGSRFTAAGFDHRDLIFPDGTSPTEEILHEFLDIVETAKGGVAVHCKAGLGRTGTLIAAFMMKHHQFSPAQAIAWTRIARPGSVIGQQQHFLEAVKDRLWVNGMARGESSFSSFGSDGAPPLEILHVSSSISSTETVDEKGFSTLVEIAVIETTVSSADRNELNRLNQNELNRLNQNELNRLNQNELNCLNQNELNCLMDSTASSVDEAEVRTQGDELNMRKAQRIRENGSERQTRSKCRATTSDPQNSVKKRQKKKKKNKIR